jgi:hypothetical protein
MLNSPEKFVLALYYTVADMGLIWQVIYYQRKEVEREEVVLATETTALLGTSNNNNSSSSSISNSSSNSKRQTKTKLINWLSAMAILLVTLISCYTYYNAHWHKHLNHGEDEQLKWLPQLMGWTSAILYIGSRIPQILKNWRNKSTEGLSFGMFLCAVMGNILFTSVK